MELKKKIVQGLRWNLGVSVIGQVLNLITKIILARVLFPADFGLFAMALIVISFLSIFTGFGIMSAVIYKKDEEEKTFHTAFLLSIIMGIFLCLVSFFSSAFVASFFHQPQLVPMVQLLSILFLFDNVSAIFNGVLLKNLDYKKKALADIGGVFFYTVTVILLASKGVGVWSIVIAYAFQSLSKMLLLFFFCPRKPSIITIRCFDKRIAKELFQFGAFSSSAALITWAITSIDNIIVGKRLGDESLGYYSFGFNIAALPVLSITHLITGVFHPVYAKLQNDAERLKEAYLKPLEWCLLIMLPLSAGMYILANRIVTVVFGEKWLLMIPLLKIFAVYCVLRTVCTVIAQLLEGIGKPKNAARVVFIELLLLAIFIFFGVKYGIAGVAVAVVLAKAVATVLYLGEIRKVLFISLMEYQRIILRKALATGFMSLCVFGLTFFFSSSSAISLFSLVAAGLIFYFVVLYLLEKRIFNEGWNLICRQ